MSVSGNKHGYDKDQNVRELAQGQSGDPKYEGDHRRCNDSTLDHGNSVTRFRQPKREINDDDDAYLASE